MFNRDEALGQATRLFWLKGYEATSISDLTEALSIGSTSLYAAFGSKEQLYVEALQHYGETYEGFVFANFRAAETGREAVKAYLMDSAAALTGTVRDVPRGCMAALAFVGSDGHSGLADHIRSMRMHAFHRLKARLDRAVVEGDLPSTIDVRALARFVQTVQSGMSILARDGADQAELEAVAEIAISGWETGPGKA